MTSYSNFNRKIYHLIFLSTFKIIKSPASPSNLKNRTNFCHVHQQIERNEILLENALRGLDIHVAIYPWSPGKPRADMMIFDELSNRAGFHWRNTVTTIPFPGINKTFTDEIVYYNQQYDILLDWWARTIERLSLGAIYTEEWYDADTIIVQKAKNKDSADAFHLFAMFQPFTAGLWGLIFVTICATAIVHYLLDYLYCKSHKKEMEQSGSAIFFTCQLIMGQFGHIPKSIASCTLSLSTSFLSLILIAAFTANLTNWFVMKNSSRQVVNSIDDIIRYDLRCCSVRGFFMTEELKRKYPVIRILEVDTDNELFWALGKRECDVGLTTMEVYKEKSNDKAFNRFCDITWVGRRVSTQSAGFAMDDSKEFCSSVFRNALDVHFFRMKSDGTLKKIWREYRDMVASDICKIVIYNDESDVKGRLSIAHLAGVFLFHAIIIFLSIVYGFYELKASYKNVKT